MRASPSAPAAPLFDIVSNENSFKHPLIGSRWLNRLGLHGARVAAAGLCSRLRRIGAGRASAELRERLWRDGYLVIVNLLPAELFEPARREFQQRVAAHEAEAPRPPVHTRGFGSRLPNEHGFDRADGGSLNRYIALDERAPLLHRAFSGNVALRRLLRALTGAPVPPEAFWLHQLVHGNESLNPDPQRRLHCDGFHDGFKLWYFFEPVRAAEAPLVYVPGSQRSDAARLRWERRQILAGEARSAAFRAGTADLAAMGSAAPRAVATPANSLLLVNTRGFHARGVAPAGWVQHALYASLRPRAFALRP